MYYMKISFSQLSGDCKNLTNVQQIEFTIGLLQTRYIDRAGEARNGFAISMGTTSTIQHGPLQ